jgi:hypothetical protein
MALTIFAISFLDLTDFLSSLRYAATFLFVARFALGERMYFSSRVLRIQLGETSIFSCLDNNSEK